MFKKGVGSFGFPGLQKSKVRGRSYPIGLAKYKSSRFL